jgi:predicted phosphodiesterase
MVTIYRFEEEINKYGLTIEEYDDVIKTISEKMAGLNDIDWTEIKEEYNINAHYDTIRKASQTIFGGAFVSQYLKWKGEINSSSTTKITQAKELIGEQFILKKQLQSEKSQIDKLKKGFVKSISIAEELAEIQSKNGLRIVIPESCNTQINEFSEYEMIVNISDWHIGYVIEDCKGNNYNWVIANDRVDKFLNEIKKYIAMYGVKKIYVINTGDVIEQTYMRKNQSQFCEFNQSEQINKAIELVYRFLVSLCEVCDVEYDSIYGNHDRTNGDLSANLDGDNAETIIREQLSKYKEISDNNRLTVINRKHTDKELTKEVKGLKIKAIHGDKAVKDDKTQLKNTISMDEEFYSILLKGHEHNHRVISENKGRYIICTGCLSGFNDYSTAFGCATVASQTILVVKQNEIELIKDVQLK